jgi:hypothetical protein
MGPDPLLQFDGISLDPPEDRRVIHRHPAIQKHQLKVAIADGERQILSWPPDLGPGVKVEGVPFYRVDGADHEQDETDD